MPRQYCTVLPVDIAKSAPPNLIPLSDDGSGNVPVDVTLHPKAADILVTWNIHGNPCPPGVTLPYSITLYKPPDSAGGPLTQKVAETQMGCQWGQATLTNVQPGTYIVELNSQAVTP
jgi:hypothetical protein